MKNLALIINENQNIVCEREINIIKQEIEKEFSKHEIQVIANEEREKSIELAEEYDDVIVYNTKDVNYNIWAEFVLYHSTLKPTKETIELN